VIKKLLQGAFIGVSMVLPGLSAGTVILILGFYRRFIDDLAAVKLKPYLPIFAGAGAGIFLGALTINFLLEHYGIIIMSFLYGMLLGSVPAVIAKPESKRLLPGALLFALAGFVLTWFFIADPARAFTALPEGGLLHFLLGGTLSSATMLLPGLSGGAVLVIISIYDEVIYALSNWQWLRLIFFSAGFLIGLFGLARLLSAIYRRYRVKVSFLLAGLIAGSTRALLPEQFSAVFFIFAALGIAVVLYFTRHRENF